MAAVLHRLAVAGVAAAPENSHTAVASLADVAAIADNWLAEVVVAEVAVAEAAVAEAVVAAVLHCLAVAVVAVVVETVLHIHIATVLRSPVDADVPVYVLQKSVAPVHWRLVAAAAVHTPAHSPPPPADRTCIFPLVVLFPYHRYSSKYVAVTAEHAQPGEAHVVQMLPLARQVVAARGIAETS